jgi:hypothetical protein
MEVFVIEMGNRGNKKEGQDHISDLTLIGKVVNVI